MRRLLYLATVATVATLLFAPAAMAQEEVACPAGEVNVLTDNGFICVPANVEDQTPAETEAVVNDPRPNAETEIVENQGVPESETPAQDDLDCADLTFEEANNILAQDPSDPNGLDADGDGRACEENVPFGDSLVAPLGSAAEDSATGGDQYETPETPTATGGQYEAPETAPATETGTALPDTGGPGGAALLLPAAGLLLATGLIGLRVVRRK